MSGRMVWARRTESGSQHYLTWLEVKGRGSRALIVIPRIQTWALEEARRRLEVEGILPDPDEETKNQT